MNYQVNSSRILKLLTVGILIGSLTSCGNQEASTTKPESASYVEPAIGKSGGFVYRYVGNKQERLDIAGQWAASDVRSDGEFDPTRVAAYESIQSLPKDNDYKNFLFEYLFQPSFPGEIENVIKLQAIEFAQKFSKQLNKPITVKIVGITEKNGEYIANELPSIIPQESFGNSLEILEDYVSLERFYRRGGTGGGSAWYSFPKKYGYYLAHTSSLATTDTYWPEVVPHEMSHVLTGYLTADSGGNRFPEGDPKSKINGHFIEGSANTLGMAAGFQTLGWYSDEMDRLLARDIAYSKGWKPLTTVDDAVKFIEFIERRDTEVNAQFSYSAGQVVWEYFIGKYGALKFFEFLGNMRITPNFNENLKKTIGIDRISFYRDAGEYLMKTTQRLSKK
jgi:hypothetical protein